MVNENSLADDLVMTSNNNKKSFSYFQMLKIRFQRRVNLNRQNSDNHKSRKLKVQILIAITIAFFICNTPIHLHHLYDLSNAKSKLVQQIFSILTSLMNIHCFINGIIYSLVDFKFRRDCKNLFKSLYCWKRNLTQNQIPRNLSTTTSFYLDASTK